MKINVGVNKRNGSGKKKIDHRNFALEIDLEFNDPNVHEKIKEYVNLYYSGWSITGYAPAENQAK